MVKAIIDIDEHTNKILNIVKAKHDLKDKSQAINKMAEDYAHHVLEVELRPALVDKFREVDEE
ncbi:antitoxin [Nanoarchaeota archaeon]